MRHEIGFDARCRGSGMISQRIYYDSMKTLRPSRRAFGLWLLCSLASGCATQAPLQTAVTRFHEEASANLMVRFNRWDTIYVIRPDTREGGFLPIFTRADFEAKLNSEPMEHELAVVVLGFLNSATQELGLVREWSALLSQHGFRRVVVLRAGAGKSFDGLGVIYDSRRTSARATPDVPTPRLMLASEVR